MTTDEQLEALRIHLRKLEEEKIKEFVGRHEEEVRQKLINRAFVYETKSGTFPQKQAIFFVHMDLINALEYRYEVRTREVRLWKGRYEKNLHRSWEFSVKEQNRTFSLKKGYFEIFDVIRGMKELPLEQFEQMWGFGESLQETIKDFLAI